MPGMTQPDPASPPPAEQQQQPGVVPAAVPAQPETLVPPAEPVPVADQKAAGVPPEETVTIADQKAGTDPPPAVWEPPAADTEAQVTTLPPALQPNEGSGAEEAVPVAHPGVTNASLGLTPSAQAAAARTYGWLSHIENVIGAAKADIERYVPADVLTVAQTEAVAVVRGLI